MKETIRGREANLSWGYGYVGGKNGVAERGEGW
jgi:hypothetical protein